MKWRLIREDEEGFADFSWDGGTQQNFRLQKYVLRLEAGEVIRLFTKSGGATEWYLVPEPGTAPINAKNTTCPMCGGSGHVVTEAK